MHDVQVCFVDPTLSPEKKQILLPKRQSELASGFDLVANVLEPVVILPMMRALIPTGVAVCLEKGTEAQVRTRSGLALKNGIVVLNSPGTIDADYRGEIKVILANFSDQPFSVEFGARIAQLVITPVLLPQMTVVNQLGNSQRGEAGFGSTGVTTAAVSA